MHGPSRRMHRELRCMPMVPSAAQIARINAFREHRAAVRQNCILGSDGMKDSAEVSADTADMRPGIAFRRTAAAATRCGLQLISRPTIQKR